MPLAVPLKNPQQEFAFTKKRLAVVGVILGLLSSLLIARLFFLQVYKHDVYITLAQKNWLDILPLEPIRGLIYDRHGVLLAANVPVFSLEIIPDKHKIYLKH